LVEKLYSENPELFLRPISFQKKLECFNWLKQYNQQRRDLFATNQEFEEN